MKLSRARRIELARKLYCPKCKVSGGEPCQALPYRRYLPSRGPMEGIHKERLAQVAKETG